MEDGTEWLGHGKFGKRKIRDTHQMRKRSHAPSFPGDLGAIMKSKTAFSHRKTGFYLQRLIMVLFVLAGSLLKADLKPGPLFQDHMVLQQGKPIAVWGWDAPNQPITVSLADHTAETTADGQGYWKTYLDPMEATSTPLQMTISGTETVTLNDVLIGEVWLASGQSNMQWPVRSSKDMDIEKLAARWPLIREIDMGRKVSNSPEQQASTSGWREATTENIDIFSAVAYYFARDLHAILDVPVGIINSTWGGTRIEAWMDPETARAENGEPFAAIYEAWDDVLAAYPEAKSRYDERLNAWGQRRSAHNERGEKFTERRPSPPQGPGHPATPSGLYNGMIHPATPYSLAGVIWYQGESNRRNSDDYSVFFPAMIQGWRKVFEQESLPFYWVQLASFQIPEATEWAFLREAQANALELPHTGQAIAIDIGDVTDIHPRNKQDVGRRLARLALNRTYGVEVVDRGPVVEKIEPDGNGFRIHFTETHRGLKTPSGICSGFEVAGEDKIFYPAEATVQENTVFVSSPEVPNPVAVRYAWRNAPNPGLFNGYDLPAEPFRTDNWDME